MRILISAFACSPTGGSEGGVGWHWAMALAADGHDVTVITDVTRRAAIEEALSAPAGDGDEARPTFVFYRPAILRKAVLNRRTAQLLYSAWQYALLFEASRLHRNREFELILHVTYGVFRHPSFLGFLDAPFVFGPVGGGEEAPWRLKVRMPAREKAKELARSVLNIVARVNPLLNLALMKTDLVLAKTEDTANALPRHVRARTRVLLEIGLAPSSAESLLAPQTPRASSDTFQVLFAGRLIGVKGIDLLLESFALFAMNRPLARLAIIGSGPLATWIDELSSSLEIRSKVCLVPQLSQQALFKRYREAHVLLFPSLHDSSGNVVLECLNHALPVVCLDLGGPPAIIDESCGIAVDTRDVPRETVIARLADALGKVHDDEAARRAMCHAASVRAASWTWRSRTREALEMAASAGLVDRPDVDQVVAKNPDDPRST